MSRGEGNAGGGECRGDRGSGGGGGDGAVGVDGAAGNAGGEVEQERDADRHGLPRDLEERGGRGLVGFAGSCKATSVATTTEVAGDVGFALGFSRRGLGSRLYLGGRAGLLVELEYTFRIGEEAELTLHYEILT